MNNQRRPSSPARSSQLYQSQPSNQSSQAQSRSQQQNNVQPPQVVPDLFSSGNLQPIPTSGIQVNISQPQPQPNIVHNGPPPPSAQRNVGLPQAAAAQPYMILLKVITLNKMLVFLKQPQFNHMLIFLKVVTLMVKHKLNPVLCYRLLLQDKLLQDL